MKKAKYDNKLSMILDITKRSGMLLTAIADDLGVSGDSVSSWKTGRHSPNNPDYVVRTVRSRAKLLSKIDLDNYDLTRLRQDYGITLKALASEMNVSREALYKMIRNNWPVEERKLQAQELLRSMGRNILKSASQ